MIEKGDIVLYYADSPKMIRQLVRRESIVTGINGERLNLKCGDTIRVDKCIVVGGKITTHMGTGRWYCPNVPGMELPYTISPLQHELWKRWNPRTS